MNDKAYIKQIIVFALFLGLILLVGAFILPWQLIKWGQIGIMPGETITVTGQAQTQQRNQIAQFSAGVSIVDDDKQKAVNEVNQRIETIIQKVKDFGVEEADIKTQNISVYQDEENYYKEGTEKSRPGQWRVSNTITITLRDIDKASALTDLLTESGANNIYGPNFSVDDTTEAEKVVLDEAIKNAQEKAEIMAKSSKRRLGKILSVTEGSQQYRLPNETFAGLGGADAAIEPGSQTISKTVTVTFELR